jgi:hypothetical protein
MKTRRVAALLLGVSIGAMLIGIVLAGFTALDGAQRARNPLRVAERICNELLDPGQADSPERHQCLQHEMARPAFSVTRFVPAISATLIAVAALGGYALARLRLEPNRAGLRAPGPS